MQQKFDVVVVGAGLAGLTAAYHLAGEGLDVAVFERGPYPGSKNITGGILYTTVLNKLMPNFRSEAPLERRVAQRRFYLLAEKSALSLEFLTLDDPEASKNSFTVLLSKFCQWFGRKTEEVGATIIPETVVDDLIWEDRKVVGVTARREDGDVYADLVIVADGANSLLARNADLRSSFQPSRLVVGVKEVISIPREVIEARFGISEDEGVAVDCYGYPSEMVSSGFIYTNKDSLSVGVAAYLHSLIEKKVNIFDMLKTFKQHRLVRKLVKDGEAKEYSAHLIPERYEGRTFTDGLLIVGDAAGLLNRSPLFFEGTNLAMASGLFAAEVAKKAKERSDFSTQTLSLYPKLLDQSFVMKDVKRYSRVPVFLEKHPRVVKTYPRLFNEIAKSILTADDSPKSEKLKLARKRLKKEVSYVKFLWDMYKAWRTLL